MEQLVENMDVVINERRDYITQMRQASKQKQQKNEWLSARIEENRLRSEMGDEPVAGRGGSCAFSGDGERVREEGR